MQNKTVTLALQGGGSHGAFTWGVLDRLLEDARIDIEGVSGASAGAMNAVVMSHGYAAGGRDGARQALSDFWESVSTNDLFSFMSHHALSDAAIARQASSTAVLKGFFSMTRLFSPYQFNPFDLNPLRDILVKQIDFDRLRTDGNIKLFIAATQVSTGTLKIFRNRDLSLEALLASACLPSMHHAISDEIGQRLTEISFSSTFFTELGGIALARRNIAEDPDASGKLEQRLKNLNMHVIDANELMSHLSGSSKFNTKASFINALRDAGRQQADTWLAEKFDDLGRCSSFDLDQFIS